MRPLRFLMLTLAAALTLLSPGIATADEPKPKESQSPAAQESRQPRENTPGTGNEGGSGTTSDTAPGGVSVPRVMLQSVTAEPAVVPAGSSFTLRYTLVNQSKRTRVSNLKVTLAAADGAFLPTTGSSSTFISTIKPEGAVSRDITFSTLPSLENRPYAITMTIEYEDAQANSYTTTETISVPISQPTRADTSSFTVSPADLLVGDEATVTFSLNNLGKSKIFNARISIAEGQGVAAKEQFIGSVEAGAAANVEMLLTAVEERLEPVTAVITFENADGTEVTLEKQLTVMIAAIPVPEPEEPNLTDPALEQKPAENGDAWLWWVIGGVSLGVLLLIASIVIGRRAKQRREQSSDLDLLDGTPLVGSDR